MIHGELWIVPGDIVRNKILFQEKITFISYEFFGLNTLFLFVIKSSG